MGLVLLLFVGLLCATLLFVWGIVRDAHSPSRATIGWALARKLPVDPAALGLEFAEESWGANQTAWRIRGGAPSSDVTTIIIHGWRRSRIDSLRRIHPWLGVSKCLWLVDLAGHGDAPEGATTLGVRDVDAVVTLAHTLLGQSGDPSVARSAAPTRLVLVGHSLGAAIAVRAAAQLPPTTLAGVVAIAPYESLKEPLANRLRARALPAVPFAQLAQHWLHALCGREKSVIEALTQLRANRVRTLLIASTQDTVVRFEHVQHIAQCAQVPLITVTESAHDDLATGCHANATTPCARALREFLETALCTSAVTSRRAEPVSTMKTEP
ncbi:MAG: alpha/beta fold hydrolase [Phycisphaerales bacterium]|nr:alpha/beta fold hydrolase [Phycisphaerales bacterium]